MMSPDILLESGIFTCPAYRKLLPTGQNLKLFFLQNYVLCNIIKCSSIFRLFSDYSLAWRCDGNQGCGLEKVFKALRQLMS